MNMMMVIGDTLYTAPLTSTILPGVTRDSFLTLARDAGINIKEESVSTDMLIESIENNSLKEVFGVGTAATTAQVQKLTFKGKTYDLPAVESRTISNSIGGLLLDIKTGKATDNKGWNTKL